MKVIWKFPLEIGSENRIFVNQFYRVVLTAMDHASGKPAVWIEHDPTGTMMSRTFVIFGTGQQINGPPHAHVGSVIDGQFVWHIYERNG